MTLPVPETFTTGRLALARLRRSDAAEVFAAYAQDPEVTRYLTWRPNRCVEETQAHAERCERDWDAGHEFTWAIRLREGALIGALALRPAGTQASVGYVLARPHWGHGYMTEAVRAVVNWAFTRPDVHRVWAVCDVDNPASARVMAKAGMTCEGVLRRWSVHPNISETPRDTLCYSRVRDDAAGGLPAAVAAPPILEFDPDRYASLSPQRFHQPRADMPERAVLCFFQDVIEHLRDGGFLAEITSLKSEMGRHPVYRLGTPMGDVALMHPGIGGPLAAGCMEELIALGVGGFVACGGAGVLDSAIAVGAVLIPTAAVRDEGTSYHYLAPAREVAVDEAVVRALESGLEARGVPHRRVKTWTTDAFYRETPGRIARRKADGCTCVEMETASLCAVARFRGVPFGQLLYAGDDVGASEWSERSWKGQWSVRERLTQLAAELALELPVGRAPG